MKKIDVVRAILKNRMPIKPKLKSAQAFAPTNIALCKYWGKRNSELNLPVTSSLSISLGNKGAKMKFTVSDQFAITLNGKIVELSSGFATRLLQFLQLFQIQQHFNIRIETNIPIAAGLASSACGFAACVQALNKLFAWKLTDTELSILARLGSGSASRSCWQGFVEWYAGKQEDGMDSYAEPIEMTWPELRIGILLFSEAQKNISSREAMQRTVETSALYATWPQKVAADLIAVKRAIISRNFNLLGKTAESNAIAMHETMLHAWPPVNYFLPSTKMAMQHIWDLRAQGLPLYFTQDAGPNLKLLFLEKDSTIIQQNFPTIEIIQPFL